jgi:deoxyribonuclease-4
VTTAYTQIQFVPFIITIGTGARFDIHEHIGLGKIGVEGLKTIINHKSLRNLPMVIQVPYMSINDHSEELKNVRKLRN